MNDTKRKKRKWIPRISLRWLMLGMIPVAICLTMYGHAQRKIQRAIYGKNAIFDKGVDLHYYADGVTHVIRFKNRNVTDEDLATFIPAFNGSAPSGYGTTVGLELMGSPVSDKAVQRFERAVPECEVVR